MRNRINLLESELRGAILTICALFVSLVYALPYYHMSDFYPLDTKPYVYRQLSLWSISLLDGIGFEYEFASMLFIAVSGAALVFALMFMLITFDAPTLFELRALGLLALFTIVFQRYLKPYDLPTAFFFTMAITLMARRQVAAYLFVFFLSSINRETTILLLPIFLVTFWRRFNLEFYGLLATLQAVTFVTVQAVIRYIFRDAPGSSVWISPAQNIAAHLQVPLHAGLSLAVAGVILWLVLRNWKVKPIVLRTAFVVLAPALVLLYLVAGQAFEYRVFAEVYSVTALLVLPVQRAA